MWYVPAARLTNAGTVSTRGVELDFNAAITDDFSLSGGVNYTDAHINKFICPTGAAVTCADAINGKGTVPGGKLGLTVDGTYKDAFGC